MKQTQFPLFSPSPSLCSSSLLPPPALSSPALPLSRQDQVDAAIAKLKDLKLDQEKAHKAHLAATGGGGAASSSSKKGASSKASAAEVFRAAVANALERRLFYLPSFKIYGAVAGFYDYGPPGCAVKQNVTQLWRRHFVLEEGEIFFFFFSFFLFLARSPRFCPSSLARSLSRRGGGTSYYVSLEEKG